MFLRFLAEHWGFKGRESPVSGDRRWAGDKAQKEDDTSSPSQTSCASKHKAMSVHYQEKTKGKPPAHALPLLRPFHSPRLNRGCT